MKAGVLGSGDVAKALAAGFVEYGHEVVIGTRDASKLENWVAAHASARVGSFAEAASHGEVVVLAVKGTVAAKVLGAVGSEALAGKPVIDATNPIADGPATNGVISFFTGPNDSLMEQLQREFPDARLVKAFNSVGNQHMVDPRFEGGPPTMFICGNNGDAKRTVSQILDQFGWDVADMGAAEAARAIEPLCMLWVVAGVVSHGWDHAFKLVRN
ncbi:NADPH-dependent F420 reductase [Phytoactinopolyspora mesophila]|uniref:DNA-binding protein n=1 Tax=Phytoactinopolyspora mesophila TaxID=2650750 RepID=A0A7K3M692_9ACTN|nr:NAD(P)-binding domain-containing protein [Phytoactinopolyspora mesophila]NDL58841.1 DNA-binding protein [Phytoactinopolyspora mesophila]